MHVLERPKSSEIEFIRKNLGANKKGLYLQRFAVCFHLSPMLVETLATFFFQAMLSLARLSFGYQLRMAAAKLLPLKTNANNIYPKGFLQSKVNYC